MKKINFAFVSLLIAGASLLFSSCGKYEEGPGFTVLTKKMRLVGEWNIKTVTSENGNTINYDNNYSVTFEKDGTFKTTKDGLQYTGKWEFASKKEKVTATYTFGNLSKVYERTIIRLTNKELWVKDTNGDLYKAEKK